ncbi:MBL fold metallo-hydrolase [Oceanobacillus senegalensis]|uniref:MBL fold metallo-hydrolase n=1 Tax=Oceanobacillus senegalensis TaxID=1936063 RepID=UPI001FE50723|nr:MBL fold metallo-hydrolase [Oceanobacillus senegalensis]
MIYPIMVHTSSSLRTVNFYLIETGHSLILVDAGWNNDDSKRALQQTLEENDFSLSDLTDIVLTHNHPDHIGLVNQITDKHPIPVFAHKDAIPRMKREREFLEMRLEFFKKLYEEMGCGEAGEKQVRYLRDAIEKNSGQSIQAEITPIGNTHRNFQVIEVPGHAPDQIALWSEKRRELLSGDLLIDHISSNALVEPDYNGERLPTLLQHKHSLEKVLNLSVDRVFSGHGMVIENPTTLIKKRIVGMERKAQKFKNLMKEEGLTTASDIAKVYYKKSYFTQFSLVMSEVIGHLDYMERNEQITKEKKHAVWHYSIA